MNTFVIKNMNYQSDEIVEIELGISKGCVKQDIISSILQRVNLHEDSFEIIENKTSNALISAKIKYSSIKKIENIEGIEHIRVIGKNDLPFTTNDEKKTEVYTDEDLISNGGNNEIFSYISICLGLVISAFFISKIFKKIC